MEIKKQHICVLPPNLRNMYFYHLLPYVDEAMVVLKKFNFVSFFLIFEIYDFVSFILFYFMGFISFFFFLSKTISLFFFLSLMSFTLMTMEVKPKSIENQKNKNKNKNKKQDLKTIAMEIASQLKNTNEVKSVWPCFLGEVRRLDCYVNVIQ